MNVESIKDVGAWAKSGIITAWHTFVRAVVTWGLSLILISIVLTGLVSLIPIDTPIPASIQPYSILYGYVILFLLIPTELVRQWLATQNNELLSALDTPTGDTGIYELSPRVWDELDVKTVYRDDSGEMHELDRDKDDLHNINVDTASGSRTGVECEYYDKASNTAYCTRYPGGVSGTEIRRNLPDSIDYLKHRAAVKAEWHDRFLRNFTDILDSKVRSRVNYILHTLGDSIVPSEGQSSLRDEIKAATGEAEIADIAEGERHPDDEIEMDNPFKDDRLSVQLSDEGDDQ